MEVTVATKRNAMHPLPTATSTQFITTRTDDDINAAVANFLQNEGKKFQGRTWQDTTGEVTQWLGSQIQQEREGWTHKTRAAMQEIETHRKETLKFQGILQECTDKMKLMAEVCYIPEETLEQIAEEEPKLALPHYIDCVSESLTALMEDRILCLQILRAEEKGEKAPLPNLLKAYIETLKHHAEKAYKEAKNRLESLEGVNKQCIGDMQKMKKVIQRKQEEVERLKNKLHEIKELTFKKFKEVKDLTKERVAEKTDMDEKSSQTDLPVAVPTKITSRVSTPSSLYSAPTPITMDETGIKISEEKLSKLRRSAKKLENSLQDALTQMDNYRKDTRPTKFNQSSIFSNKISPFGLPNIENIPPSLRKDMKLLPSPLHTWGTTGKFEVSLSPQLDKLTPRERQIFQQREKIKNEKKARAREKRKMTLVKNQEKMNAPIAPEASPAPTFRSLINSLDQVKKNSPRNFKPVVGQVTKCLRCNKLFTLNDNHKKACCYHPKGKERIEQYSDRGKLVKVTYNWKCCMSGPDNAGCTYGQHV